LKLEENEERLLRACLSSDAQFLKSFRAWESIADLDALNSGAVRLIPFLKTRLDKHSIYTELENKLNGIYRFFWAKRQVQQVAIDNCLVPMVGNHPAIALKGMALESLAYNYPELRPFDDVDLLVSRPDYFALAALASEFGLKYSGRSPERSTVYLRHAKSYIAQNLEVDIHWTAIPTSSDHNFEYRMLSRAKQGLLSNLPFLTPDPTDCLLHTVLHGNRDNSVSPVRWYLDAYLLIERNSINWEQFWGEAQKIGLVRQAKKGLQRLNDLMGYDFAEVLHAPGGLRGFIGFSPARLPALMKHGLTAGKWVHLLRLVGSDVVVVRKALAMDGGRSGLLPAYVTAYVESFHEVKALLKNHSSMALFRNSWTE
jgi:hypothetical protein